jgi:CheY-like chemotaxis protein
MATLDGPRARVLVADDRAEDRAWLAATLRACGYEVSQAHDGREVLDVLFAVPAGHFDAVICDHCMPGRRGTECLALAASRARWVIVTASSDPSVERSAALFGATAVLHKPFDARTLLETLESILPPDRAHDGAGVLGGTV